MLELELLKSDIVVLSDSNNPRLLNPDFLERNAIVPKGKGWEPTDVIVTPPFARVQYANGVRIQAEENKLQFTCEKFKEFPWRAELPRIAATYLDVLPHVTYRSVGLNYQLTSSLPQGQAAEDQLMTQLLKAGPWTNYAGGLTGVNFEFQYRAGQPKLALRVGAKEVATPNGGRKLEGYMFQANIHHDFAPADKTPRREYMTTLGDRCNEVIALIEQLALEPTWQKPH